MADKKIRGNFPASEGMAQVDTIAELKALVETDVDSVTVLGYFAPGDIETRVARFDSASTTSDNGGTVIIPTYSGFGGTGRWVFDTTLTYPEYFGAKGDNSTDDTNAIVSWLVVGGNMKMLPNKTYLIDSDVQLIGGSNINLEGNSATLKYTVNAPRRGLQFIEATNIRVSNLNIVGPSDTFIINGIEVQNCSNVWWDNIHVKDVGFFGFAVVENTTTTEGKPCNNINVTNCIAENCGTFGFEFFPKAISFGLKFIGNEAINCGALSPGNGAGIKVGQSYIGAVVADNITRECEKGFAIANWFVATFSNNLVINSNSHAYNITVDTHPTFPGTFISLVLNGNVSVDESGHVPRDPSDSSLFISANRTDNGPIHIINHSVITPKLESLQIRPVAAVPNILIEDSYFDCKAPILIDDTNGAAPNGLIIRNTEFVDTDRTNISQHILFESPNGIFENNTLNGFGELPLRVIGDKLRVNGCKFIDTNVTDDISAACIVVNDNNAGTYAFFDNYMSGDNHKSMFWAVGTTPILKVWSNKSIDLISVKLNSSMTIVNGTEFIQHGANRLFYGSAAPVSGAHAKGDIVINDTPTAGGFVGFVCTNGGTPGTWKTYGVISA